MDPVEDPAVGDAGLDNGADYDPARRAGQVRWGALSWLAAGLAGGIAFFVAATVGLVIIPVVVPLAVFVFILVEVKAERPAAAVVGLFVAVDLFVVSLLLDPPCVAPFLREVSTGGFVSGCNETQSVAGLALSAGLGNVFVIALAWALIKRRKLEAAASRDTDVLG